MCLSVYAGFLLVNTEVLLYSILVGVRANVLRTSLLRSHKVSDLMYDGFIEVKKSVLLLALLIYWCGAKPR